MNEDIMMLPWLVFFILNYHLFLLEIKNRLCILSEYNILTFLWIECLRICWMYFDRWFGQAPKDIGKSCSFLSSLYIFCYLVVCFLMRLVFTQFYPSIWKSLIRRNWQDRGMIKKKSAINRGATLSARRKYIIGH